MDTPHILGVLQLFMFLVEEIANPNIRDVLITLLSVSVVFYQLWPWEPYSTFTLIAIKCEVGGSLILGFVWISGPRSRLCGRVRIYRFTQQKTCWLSFLMISNPVRCLQPVIWKRPGECVCVCVCVRARVCHIFTPAVATD